MEDCPQLAHVQSLVELAYFKILHPTLIYTHSQELLLFPSRTSIYTYLIVSTLDKRSTSCTTSTQRSSLSHGSDLASVAGTLLLIRCPTFMLELSVNLSTHLCANLMTLPVINWHLEGIFSLKALGSADVLCDGMVASWLH